MNLSRGAMRLLRKLRSLAAAHKGAAFAFQRTLAAWFKVTVRTIQYWVAELRKAGLVQVKQRGSPTETRRAALYLIDESVVSEICGRDFAPVFAPESPLPITEREELKGKALPLLLRKPSQSEQPLSQRILDILFRRRDNIAAAQNPARYRAAIIASELQKEPPKEKTVSVDWSQPDAYQRWCKEMGRIA